MLLKDKNAVIYGAGGSIGGAVARAFARAGANVYLTGRTLAKLKDLAEEIAASGASVRAEVAEVDALDRQAVGQHLELAVKRAGRIDIPFQHPSTASGSPSLKWPGKTPLPPEPRFCQAILGEGPGEEALWPVPGQQTCHRTPACSRAIFGKERRSGQCFVARWNCGWAGAYSSVLLAGISTAFE